MERAGRQAAVSGKAGWIMPPRQLTSLLVRTGYSPTEYNGKPPLSRLLREGNPEHFWTELIFCSAFIYILSQMMVWDPRSKP